jgi:DNA (cytosine-5)-methyltransferase 1
MRKSARGRKGQRKTKGDRAIAVVDLFCGAGGLTRGLMNRRLKVVAGVDIDEACRFPFEANNRSAKFLKADVADLSGRTVAAFYPKGAVRALVGCAPCQPFSRYTHGLDTTGDTKWGLLESFARLVEEVRPEIVSMENVPELERHSVFDTFVRRLEKLKYHVSYSVVFCPDYGVPQHRSRLVLLASLRGEIKIGEATHTPETYPTVKSAIGGLPRLAAGKSNQSDPLHRTNGLSPLNLKRIRASKPGGTWKDWPPSLVSPCHRKKKGKTYPGVYARMRWEAPSPTITTQFFGYGNGRFGHPTQSRAISLREGAILQSFPETYKFVEPGGEYSMTTIGRLIGNAVPVKLGEAIGRSILNHIREVS